MASIYHVWPLDPAMEWEDTVSAISQDWQISPTGVHVYDNGNILVVFQGHNTFPFGVGVAMFDKSGKLLWKKANNAHHWFDIDDDGLIYVPTQRLLDSPLALGNTGQRLICEDKIIIRRFYRRPRPKGQRRR